MDEFRGCSYCFILFIFRSAESNQRCPQGFESRPSQQVREMCRGTHGNASAGGQHMKTILIPKSMMSAPFLQHPALTTGQRRYLCSIANVYSTAHMRQQMKQRYLNVLHTCVQPGQNPSCRRRFGIHQHRDDSTLSRDAEKDVARAKPQGQMKSRSSSTANSDVLLPKIVNR
ncbi:protein FAM216A-like isoform X2 [Anarrhichthys ocellatus]|uniref:protein FAM216A-like isoform X2 n=1 Tax=Anarrhichthys ocellatus TaxID=433405 RepID=UPI0012EE33C5|nr:protein FAM216A-like isoform X2 [Anarrhichthys ocellatus]